MDHAKRSKLIVAAACVAIIASAVIGYLFSGPSRASVSPEALKAAESLRNEVAGTTGPGTQKKDENGVPLDARPPAGGTAGKVESKRR